MTLARLPKQSGYYAEQGIEQLKQGKVRSVGTVTLAASASTTVVTHVYASANSRVFFMPTTANAAAEIGAGTMYVSSRGKQTFTISHANNGLTDRTFEYVLLGEVY